MKNNQKLIIIGLLSLVLGIIVFSPILGNFNSSLKINRKLRQELGVLEKKLDQLEGIDQELISQRVIKMEGVFPSDKPIVAIISSLSQLAKKHFLGFGGIELNPGSLAETEGKPKVKSIKTKPISPEVKEMSFGFEVSGEFGNLLNFLVELEKLAPLMKIDNVGLSIKTNPLFDEAAMVVTAALRVTAYYQPAPKSLGLISQPIPLLSKNDELILERLFKFTQFPVVLPAAQSGKEDLFAPGP